MLPLCVCVCVYTVKQKGNQKPTKADVEQQNARRLTIIRNICNLFFSVRFFFLLETKRCKTTRTSRLINSKKHGTFIMAAIKRIYEMLNDKQACMLHATGGRTDGRGRVDAQCVMCCVSAQYSVSALVTFFF